MRFIPNMMLLVWAGLLLAGCGCAASPEKAEARIFASGWTENSAQNAAFELKCGETLEVRLKSNASTGYVWSMEQHGDPGVLTLEGKESRCADAALCGAPGETVWRFRAQRPGFCELDFRYFRPWEKFDRQRDARRLVSVTVAPAE